MNLKTLKSTLFLFLTGIIITSCELQEEVIHQHEHNSNVKLYEMKFEELMTNKRFVTSFSKLPKSKKSLTTATVGRTVMENEYGFTIANKPAKVIEDNGETSYTFLITRDSTNANSFENLVIQTDSTNTTKAVIIKYNLTSPITSSADDSYSFTYNREITPIVYNNTTVSETSKMVIVCHWVYTLVCNNTRTGGIGPEHIAGPDCGRTYYNWTEECFSFDDGISNGGGSGPTGSGPTGGSTNTGSNVGSGGTGGIITSPVNNSIEYSETVSNFLQSLTPNQLEYWDGLSPREQKIIVNYLEQPGADVIFVKELMDLARQNSEITNETIINTINEKSNDNSLNLQQAFTLAIINNSENPMTGANVELYLLLKYKNTSYFNSTSFAVVSNSINVGNYTLTPHYKSNNILVYYSAVRYSGSSTLHGIEYIIKPSGLSNFQQNIDLYTHAANLFYMNGTPSNGQIALCAGDYFSGLSQMWNDALHSPQWWAYAITCFGHAIVGLPANTNVGSTITSSQWKYSMKNLTNKAFQGKTVTNPQGVSATINIPNNYVPSITNNGQGINFRPNPPVGTHADAGLIRIMQPGYSGGVYYPKGYVVFYNNYGQAINPITNQTLSTNNWHFKFQ